MSNAVIITTLAISGALGIALFSLKGLLDQLPAVFESWHRARSAWRAKDGEDGDGGSGE
ncbi:hypothetical protein [Streptomyces sp. NPDC056682]|uniref:hypothetical protein n=1 Tax=Streptomyces sp. NPDC056682 TaxID=3345909 RepID=UPI0036C3CADD